MLETNPNEFSAWDKAKRAVSQLFNWNRADATQTTQPESDKKQMLFVLADKNNPERFDQKSRSWVGDYSDIFDKGVIGEMGGHPAIYYLNSAKEGIHDPGVVIRTIREHVQKYGTLKELRISGHGWSNHMGMSADLNLRHFLGEIEHLQQELGLKISDRIVFDGCGVFANLYGDDQKIYKQHAKRLGTEIAGATTIVYGSSGGRFIEFSPDGAIKRDHLDDPEGYHRGQSSYRTLGLPEPRWAVGGDDWAESELMKPMVSPPQKSKTGHPKHGKQEIQ